MKFLRSPLFSSGVATSKVGKPDRKSKIKAEKKSKRAKEVLILVFSSLSITQGIISKYMAKCPTQGVYVLGVC